MKRGSLAVSAKGSVGSARVAATTGAATTRTARRGARGTGRRGEGGTRLTGVGSGTTKGARRTGRSALNARGGDHTGRCRCIFSTLRAAAANHWGWGVSPSCGCCSRGDLVRCRRAGCRCTGDGPSRRRRDGRSDYQRRGGRADCQPPCGRRDICSHGRSRLDRNHRAFRHEDRDRHSGDRETQLRPPL